MARLTTNLLKQAKLTDAYLRYGTGDFEEDNSNSIELYNKLRDYEDIEEEYQISLPVLFKAFKFGIYVISNYEIKYIEGDNLTPDFHEKSIVEVQGKTYYFNSYNKDWSLNKSDLKVEKRPTTKVSANPYKIIFGPDTVWDRLDVFEPNAKTGKYRMIIIVKKDSPDVVKIQKVMELIYQNQADKLDNCPFDELISPLHDGDIEREGNPLYKGCYFIPASSTTIPGIVDTKLNPITNRNEIYDGVKGRVSATFYPFNKDRRRGFACGLNNLQKF